MDGMKKLRQRLWDDMLDVCKEYESKGMSMLEIFEALATFTTLLAKSVNEAGGGTNETRSLVADSDGPNGWMG